MKRCTMIATTVAALAGLWIPAHAQIAALDVIVALKDNGKDADTAAAQNAATPAGGEMKNDEDGDAAVIGAKDTVYVMEKWHHHAFWKEEGARKLWREKGYGVGGGFTPAVIGVNTRPLKEIINEMEITKGRTFNLNSYNCEAVYASGGMGYIGVGNGVRIGGGGLSGERFFASDRVTPDTALSLRLKVQYGGFLIEKSVVHRNANFIAGGYIGGGTMTVSARFNQAAGFTPIQQFDARQYNSVTANFFLTEIHGGVTYTVLPWFHIGADASLPVFYSAEGFQGYASSFVTVNPVFRARIIVGNLG
jgi:hypothetical protein